MIWAATARFVAAALFFDALAPLFPQIASAQGLSDGAFQTLLGASYLCFALFQLASVPLIAAAGPPRVSAWSCFGIGIGAALICATQEPALAATGLLAMFIANGIGSNATRVALRDATSNEGFRRILGWASGAVEIKQIVMPLAAGAIATAAGWRWALAALVTPVVVAGLGIELARSARAPPPPVSPQALSSASWRDVAADRAFLVPTLTAAAFQIAFGPLSARLPFMLSRDLGLDPLMAGLALSGASALLAASLFLSGSYAGRCSTGRLVGVGTLLMATGLFVMMLGRSSGELAALGLVLIQTALGPILIPCSGDALNVPPERRAKASALFGFVQPVTGGLAVAATGTLDRSNAEIAIGLTTLSLLLIVTLALTSHLIGMRGAVPNGGPKAE